MKVHPFDAIDVATLRRRRSAKWAHYPDDVLPAWVAEMDYPLAPPIRDALALALSVDDVGYASPRGYGDALAAWAERQLGWRVDPSGVTVATDVVTAIAEVLRVATEPGDAVVIDPPVYPPFASTIVNQRRVVAPAPLARDGPRLTLDLDAIERRYRDGARVHLLCSPHNPAGVVHSTATLARLAEIADAHGVLLVSDEIHGALTLGDAVFRPLPTISSAAAERAIVLTSASKAWNLAGLKAAAIVAGSAWTRKITARLPVETPFHAGHFGVLASKVAFAEGDAWLADVRALLLRNRDLLGELLAEALPGVRYDPPQASYLAWLDCRALGLGDDPAAHFLAAGRVALSPGPTFGIEGRGFLRLNFATTRALLVEIVERMRTALRSR